MSFRLVPKSVTLNDHERRNGPYSALFHRIRVASWAQCVQVVDDVVKEFAFAMSSPDEFLIEICQRTDRQTDIHAHCNTSHPYRGQSNENTKF